MTPHAHHFRIDEPAGATSQGSCQCGEQREFANVVVSDMAEGDWKRLTLARRKQMKMIRCECGKAFLSERALAGHMRSHERTKVG